MRALQVNDERDTIDLKQRALMLAVRQGLLAIVGAIEDYLGIERTWKSRKQRQDERHIA